MMNLIEHRIAVPVSGGRVLSGHVWRPRDSGRWPAIIDASPYRAGDIFRPLLEPQLRYFAEHGYAAIAIDIAGSGSSTGVLRDEYEPSEIGDLVETISWVEEQPWCDGGVGLSGFSWAAFAALRASSKSPPALKAMVLGGVSDDGWRTDIHYLGGVAYTAQVDWAGVMLMFNSLPPDPMQFDGDWRAEWKRRLTANEPFITRWLAHPAHDDYWQDRAADLSRSSELPLLLYAGLADKYAISVLHIAEQWRGPVRTVIGAWEHSPPDRALRGPVIGFRREALRWWDKYLKGIETHVADEAPLRLWLAAPDRQGNLEDGNWINSAWPMDDVVKTTFVLDGLRLKRNRDPDSASITLKPVRPDAVVLSQDLYEDVPAPFDFAAARTSGAFVAISDPFDEPFEIGPSPLLNCQSVSPGGAIIARLLDIAPDDAAVRMTTGAIALSISNSQSIVIPFQAASWRVEKGHRLGLILSADGWPTFWPKDRVENVSISALSLVVPQIARGKGVPSFAAPEQASVAMHEQLKWIDPAQETQETLPPAKDMVSMTSVSAAHHLLATGTDYYIASRFDLSPAADNRACAAKSYRVAFERTDWSIRVDTWLELSSTRDRHQIAWKIAASESGVTVHSVERVTTVKREVR